MRTESDDDPARKSICNLPERRVHVDDVRKSFCFDFLLDYIQWISVGLPILSEFKQNKAIHTLLNVIVGV